MSRIESDLLKAIEQNPNSPEGYMSLAYLLCAQGAWEKCLAVTNVGCGKFPSNASLLNSRSLACLGVGRVAEATQGFKALIELDPTIWEGYEGLIRIYTQNKQWTDCLAISSMAVRRAPDRVSFVMAKARSLAALGHTKELKKVLTTYLRRQGFVGPPPLSPGFLASHPNLPLAFFHLYMGMLYQVGEHEAASRLQTELDKSSREGKAMQALFGELDRFIPTLDNSFLREGL